MRLQGLVVRLLGWGVCAVYIWIKGDPMLIFPALMTALVANAYHRQSDDLGAEKHE